MTGRDYGLVLAIVAQRANLKGMSLEDVAASAEKDGLSPIPVWTEAEVQFLREGLEKICALVYEINRLTGGAE